MDELLNELGIKIEKYAKDKLAEDGFVEADSDVKEALNQILRLVPQVLDDINMGGAYKAIFEHGVNGTIQRAADHVHYRGNEVIKGTNNNIVGQVLWADLDKWSQIASNAFSVASVLVGEYYMKQIDSRLDIIEKSISDISSFLENAKRAKLESFLDSLEHIEKNLKYILCNANQRQAALSELNVIKRQSKENMIFYRRQIIDLFSKQNVTDSLDTAKENLKEFYNYVASYWYSLYLFAYASSLEPIVSGDNNENYLDIVESDIVDLSNNFSAEYEKWKSDENSYLKSLKKLEKNLLVEFGKCMKGFENVQGPLAILGTIAGVSEIVSDSQERKRKKYSEIYAEINKENSDVNMAPIYDRINVLLNYGKASNSRMEIVKEGEKIYFKVEDASLSATKK